jgi:hypothetical protein
MTHRDEYTTVSVRVRKESWLLLKQVAQSQGLLMQRMVTRLIDVASGFVTDGVTARKEVPFGDWMQMLATWYGRRRSYDDGAEAMRLVFEAQVEFAHRWPASLLTYDAAWSLIHWIMMDRNGLPPDQIEPEQRANCEVAWQTYVEKARLEKKVIDPLDEGAKSL